MSAAAEERLYNLLPAVLRVRDSALGEPLRALAGVIDAELAGFEKDLDNLYADQFIETCAEWLVPYIGDLVRAPYLRPTHARDTNLRAYVANTVAYRRRKGTAAVLEQIARDVTGAAARVVEFQAQVATTAHIGLPPGRAATARLSDGNVLGRIGTPFDDLVRSVEVRAPGRGAGRFGPMRLGLFLWRLQARPVERSRAVQEPSVGGTIPCYRFDPLGRDVPLYNSPRPEAIDAFACESDVPGRLRRRELAEDLAIAIANPAASRWFGAWRPFDIRVRFAGEDEARLLAPADLAIADLSLWDDLDQPASHFAAAGEPVALVDPVLGRLAVKPDHLDVEVSYFECGPGDLGGGGYDRDDPAAVTGDPEAVDAALAPGCLANALVLPRPALHAIELPDWGRYTLPSSFEVPAQSVLEIRAAEACRPVLEIPGECTVFLGQGARLVMRGVLVTGGPLNLKTVGPRNGEVPAPAVEISHCTFVPGHLLDSSGLPAHVPTPADQTSDEPPVPVLSIDGTQIGVNPPTDAYEVQVDIRRSILGTVDLPVSSSLQLRECIVDGLGALAVRAGIAHIEACTVLGDLQAHVLELATDSLLCGPVEIDRVQSGAVRYCYLPLSVSRVPACFRTVPDPGSVAPGDLARCEAELAPHFSSLRYGRPGYAQVDPSSPAEVLRGASDEEELGAWHFLAWTQRTENLRNATEDFLRLGAQAGIFFAS